MMHSVPGHEFEEVHKAIVLDVGEFIANLIQESDRALVILAAARLDVGLERLLKRVMLHHPKGQDNLFSQERPLRTFGAKIALAYRLGLIDGDFEHALRMVQRTRNEFAHSIEDASFSDPRTMSRLDEITNIAQQSKWWDEIHASQVVRDPRIPVSSSKSGLDFCTAISMMVVALEAAVRCTEPFHVEQPVGFGP